MTRRNDNVWQTLSCVASAVCLPWLSVKEFLNDYQQWEEGTAIVGDVSKSKVVDIGFLNVDGMPKINNIFYMLED